MAAPAMPGPGFVVIETKLVLGGLEAVLDGPATAFHGHQLIQGCALGAPCREEGEIAIGDGAADQETPRPLAGKSVAVLANLEIGQLEVGPVVPARAFGSCAGRQAMPGVPGKALGDRSGGT